MLERQRTGGPLVGKFLRMPVSRPMESPPGPRHWGQSSARVGHAQSVRRMSCVKQPFHAKHIISGRRRRLQVGSLQGVPEPGVDQAASITIVRIAERIDLRVLAHFGMAIGEGDDAEAPMAVFVYAFE